MPLQFSSLCPSTAVPDPDLPVVNDMTEVRGITILLGWKYMGFVIAMMVSRAPLPGKLDPFQSLSELLTLILHSYHAFKAHVAKGTLLEIK